MLGTRECRAESACPRECTNFQIFRGEEIRLSQREAAHARGFSSEMVNKNYTTSAIRVRHILSSYGTLTYVFTPLATQPRSTLTNSPDNVEIPGLEHPPPSPLQRRAVSQQSVAVFFSVGVVQVVVVVRRNPPPPGIPPLVGTLLRPRDEPFSRASTIGRANIRFRLLTHIEGGRRLASKRCNTRRTRKRDLENRSKRSFGPRLNRIGYVVVVFGS